MQINTCVFKTAYLYSFVHVNVSDTKLITGMNRVRLKLILRLSLKTVM